MSVNAYQFLLHMDSKFFSKLVIFIVVILSNLQWLCEVNTDDKRATKAINKVKKQ